jgi:hypothetical protein
MTFLLTLALGRFIYISMRKAIHRQTESANAAQAMSLELSESLGRLERRNKESGLLAEMTRLMQTELTQEETMQLARTYCRQLLSNSSGEPSSCIAIHAMCSRKQHSGAMTSTKT